MFDDDMDWSRADWRLLQNGAINLFWQPHIFAKAQQSLSELGYDAPAIYCAEGWDSVQRQFSSLLKWGEQFGYPHWNGNPNAFDDGLIDFPFGPSKRCALTLSAFQHLVAEDPQASRNLLDSLATYARYHLLFGRILIVLVQTDDNRFTCTDLGGT
ncbi:MAG: hypothetical protein ACAH11_11405, partial [Sphingomonas sp.]